MPDVTLIIRDLGVENTEKIERALLRLDFVNEANADPEKGFVAVSYEGGSTELQHIESSLEEAGCKVEPSPGAQKIQES